MSQDIEDTLNPYRARVSLLPAIPADRDPISTICGKS